MAEWTEFALACGVFLLSHAAPARPGIRERLVGALGRGAYLALYMLVSVAALSWLIAAAGRAPFVPLWEPGGWGALAPPVAMVPACLLIAFAVGAPNPLSFGGARDDRFDPSRPGVVGAARHPLLWALALWSGAHLAANGDLAHAMSFGGFLAFSLAGMSMLDRRLRRRMGAAAWERLAARSSAVPLQAFLDGRWRPAGAPSPLRLAAAAALWLALAGLHPTLFGVSALAF